MKTLPPPAGLGHKRVEDILNFVSQTTYPRHAHIPTPIQDTPTYLYVHTAGHIQESPTSLRPHCRSHPRHAHIPTPTLQVTSKTHPHLYAHTAGHIQDTHTSLRQHCRSHPRHAHIPTPTQPNSNDQSYTSIISCRDYSDIATPSCWTEDLVNCIHQNRSN